MLETFRKPFVVAAPPERKQRIAIASLLYPLTIGAVVGLGLVIRAIRVFRYHFPLNDGGLFYTMVQDLQHAHYLLPAVTSYNGDNIPFAYSPFGLYVAGILNDITPFSLVTIFRFVPLIVNVLSILAFFLLARAMLPSRAAVVAALVAFALTPRTYIWLIMGGGITRAFGFLFAILALYTVYLLYTRRERRYLLPSILFSGLTLLSHLETGEFVAYSIAVFFVCYGWDRRGVIHSALLAAGTAAITAPWWGTVIARHGLAPYQAARATGASIFTGPGDRENVLNMVRVFGVTTNEPYFWLIGSAALLGVLIVLVRALASLGRGRVLLPALPLWWGATVLLDNRAAATYNTLPMSLLVGIALAEMVLPALNRALIETEAPHAGHPEFSLNGNGNGAVHPHWRTYARQWPVVVVLGSLLWYSIFSALTTRTDVSGDLPALVSLTPADRTAMQWVAEQTPPGSQFLVISGRGVWATDMVSEWFPALTGRTSVATPQGYEWMPNKAFVTRIWMHDQAQFCAYQDSSCITRWTLMTGVFFRYVYIRTDDQCCSVGSSLLLDPDYDLLYNGPGAMVFMAR